MRVGSTRRCRRGQMQRARDRDQRLDAGIVIAPFKTCLCMESPLGQSIPREFHDFPRFSVARGKSSLTIRNVQV